MALLETIHTGLKSVFAPVKETLTKISKPFGKLPLVGRIGEAMEEFEVGVAPISRKITAPGFTTIDWFIKRYKANQNYLDTFAAKVQEKYKGPLPLPVIGGMQQIGPRVGRVLIKAAIKKVSAKTIKKILRLTEDKLVPGLMETGKRLTQIKNMRAPKLNLDRIKAPEEIKKQMVDWTNKNAQYLSDQYPHHTFNEVQAELEKSGFDILKGMRTFKKVFGGDTKKTLVAMKGLRDTTIKMEQQIASLQKTIRTTKDSDKLITLATKLKNLQLSRDGVFEAVLGSGRVSGQMLAFRKMTSQALKGTVFDKRLALEKILGKQFKVGTPAYERFFGLLKNIDPDDPKAVMQFLRQAQAVNLADFPASVWYNAVLSGPKTHLVNLSGNTMFGTTESLGVRPLAFLIDTPISKLRGISPTYTSKSTVGYFAGALRGFKIGTERFFRTMKTGFDPEEILYPSKWTQLRVSPWEAQFVKVPIAGIKEVPQWLRPILKGTGKVVDIPTRLLKAADVWFKGIFEEARKFEIAVPKVWNKTKTLRQVILEADELARTDPTVFKEAVQFGRWMTFQDAPGKMTSAIIKLRETVPGMRYVLPFINIASNLMKRGFIDYAPIGLAKGIHEIVIKNPKGAETLARGMIGTTVMLAGAMKYLEGDIILEAPRTKAERDAFYRQGKQPWSVKIGDRYVGIRRIEPFVYPYLVGALIVDAQQKGKLNESTAIEMVGSTVQKLGQFATDASYLYGVGRMYEAFNADWDEKGEQFIMWLDNLSLGFIPYSSVLRSIATAINPEVPERTTEAQEAIKSILPWMREEVKKRLTVFGEPAKYSTGAMGTFLPIATSEVTTDPVENELERLDYTVGFPSKMEGMDEESYRAYIVLAGKLTKLAVEKIIHHPAYVQVDDNTKRKLIGNIVNATRDAVRQQYFQKFKYYRYFFDQFRNQGFNRDYSEAMADKAFDILLQQSAQ